MLDLFVFAGNEFLLPVLLLVGLLHVGCDFIVTVDAWKYLIAPQLFAPNTHHRTQSLIRSRVQPH